MYNVHEYVTHLERIAVTFACTKCRFSLPYSSDSKLNFFTLYYGKTIQAPYDSVTSGIQHELRQYHFLCDPATDKNVW